MPRKITVVISQGQSANPVKRSLEGDLAAALLFESNVEVTVIPHLYDLATEGTGVLALSGISGDMIVVSWMYPRAAHWTLDRHGIKGTMAKTLIVDDTLDEDEDVDEELDASDATDDGGSNGQDTAVEASALATRKIYHLDLRLRDSADPFVEEVRRIAAEATVETVELMNWIGGSPKPEQLERYLSPGSDDGNRDGSSSTETGARSGEPTSGANGHSDSAPQNEDAPQRIEEQTARRWYPVIDFARCTNCMECIDFCLFGVYGVSQAEMILVEQPDNCRKGCPACSRVCPENAIIFPLHKAPEIAGSPAVGYRNLGAPGVRGRVWPAARSHPAERHDHRHGQAQRGGGVEGVHRRAGTTRFLRPRCS